MTCLAQPNQLELNASCRHRATAGFTLIEIVIVVGLIAVLTALAVPMYSGWRDKIKIKQAQDDIIATSLAIDAFLADNNRLPSSLTEVGRQDLRDPWGSAYQYLDLMSSRGRGHARKDHSLVPLNTDYDLYSSGPDGSSSPPLTARSSRDDILRANNSRFVGPAANY
jgi:general secretion pathway protein G